MNRITRVRKHRSRLNQEVAGKKARHLLNKARHPKPGTRNPLNLTPKRNARDN